ncbi:MAG: MFS transporter [Alphaproteobacteria bacterium]
MHGGDEPGGRPGSARPTLTYLLIAIAAMLFQQALSTLATLVFPVAIPALGPALGIGAEAAGLYSGLLFFVSSMGQLSCGALIVRNGALRMSQVSLALLGVGLILTALGQVWAIVVSAVLIGMGNSISTPASSHLLARYAPPRYAPLVFSIKQTGVPVGGMAAGAIVPLLVVSYGWRSAFLAIGLVSIAFALAIQPVRREFDRDRDPRQRFSLAAIGASVRLVLDDPGLRDYAAAMFCFVGLQAIFGAFFVSYLSDGLGYSLTAAGGVFALAQSIAIGARIAWGWIGSRLLPPRIVLGGLGLGMAAASLGIAAIGPGMGYGAVLAIAVGYSATAISWHGLLLSDVARRSPRGRIGPVTGSVVAFGGAGMMAYPLLYAGVLKVTGGYGWGFAIGAVPAALVGLRLLLRAEGPSGSARESP